MVKRDPCNVLFSVRLRVSAPTCWSWRQLQKASKTRGMSSMPTIVKVGNMGRYTVSGSGAHCKCVVIDSGGSTPSLPTNILGYSVIGNTTDFDSVVVGSSPAVPTSHLVWKVL